MDDFVYQLAAPANFGLSNKTCFAARASGLFRSDDGGVTWQLLYDSLNLSEPLPTLSVVTTPDFEHDHRLFAGIAGSVLKSTNGGLNWLSSNVPNPPPVVAALVVSPNYEQDGVIFAATMEDGVMFSSDRGDNWVAWNFGLLDLNALCLGVSPHFGQDETVFVGVQSGIFRSTNGGRAWREVELPIGYEAVISLALSPDFTHDGILFAGTESQGLLRSQDGGETWQRLGEEWLSDPLNALLLSPDFPQNPEILAVHGGIVLHSSDFGNSWAPWREQNLQEQEVATVLAPSGFAPGALIVVGLADGNIIRLS